MAIPFSVAQCRAPTATRQNGCRSKGCHEMAGSADVHGRALSALGKEIPVRLASMSLAFVRVRHIAARSSLRSAARCAVVSAALSLAFLAPRTTFADGADDDLGTADGTRLDHVLVQTRVQRDATSSTGWALVIDAENDGDAPEKCEFKTVLERSFVTPMARVASEVSTLLTRVESLTVPAHKKLHVMREIPAWLVPQLVTAERLQKARDAESKRAEKDPGAYSSAIMRAPYPNFRVAVVEPNAVVLRTRREGGMMMEAPRPAQLAKPPAATSAAVAERPPF
jgi:hypothetical protein